ncbi:UNVERIFIED_CONTAM: hypothetical protein K2H54_035905 [Gekko kuhli]
METYEQISRGMSARGHRRSATECRNKTKAMRAEYKRVLLHNNTSGKQRITCPYYNELHNILKGDPSVKPRRVADSYQFPPKATASIVTAPEAPLTPAEGSEELFTIELEPIAPLRDSGGPSDSTPEDYAEHLQDTDCTTLGTPQDYGPSTSTPDDGERLSNTAVGDKDDVDPGAILSEMTPAERLTVIRARKKRVTAVQRVGEQCLKDAARERSMYLEAARREHNEFMQEMRASRQEEREAREARGEMLRSTLQVLSDIAKAITQATTQNRECHGCRSCGSGAHNVNEERPGTALLETSDQEHAVACPPMKQARRRNPKKKVPFTP